MTCDLCHHDVAMTNRHVQNGYVEMLCNECADWSYYWDGLSPTERARFIRQGDNYVAEREAERRAWES